MKHQALIPASTDHPEVVIRALKATEYLSGCELYSRVFGYGPAQGINPRLLTTLADNSGTVVGAFTREQKIVGFAFGFLARATDQPNPYLYLFSQATVVAKELQGAGLGRSIKAVQRDIAADQGAVAMRWTYDPMNPRNAHFNLDVLGARAIDFSRDLWGHEGTDRFTVQWDFEHPSDSSPWQVPGDLRPGVLTTSSSGTLLGIPATCTVQGEPYRSAFGQAFEKGLEAVSCRRVSSELAVYRFLRRSSALIGLSGEESAA